MNLEGNLGWKHGGELGGELWGELGGELGEELGGELGATILWYIIHGADCILDSRFFTSTLTANFSAIC